MDFKFPDVGEGITEGKLVKWHVKEGDSIKSESTVASIETDKAVVDIPSPAKGVVSKLFFKPGDVVKVGEVLMTIDSDGKNTSPSTIQQIEQKIVQQEIKKIVEQKIEPAIEPKPVIQQSQPIQPVYQNSSNKEVLAMPNVRKYAKEKGIDLTRIKPSGMHGQILMGDIGNVQGTIQIQQRQVSDVITPIKTSQVSKVSVTNQPSGFNEVLATPSTKLMAREMGIDLTNFKGTGDNGMITKGDLLRYTNPSSNTPTQNISTITSQSTNNVNFASNTTESSPMTTIRQVISKRMFESIQSTAQYTVMDEVDVTELVKTREKYKEIYEKQGIKLTYLAFITKAVTLALKKHPKVNSSLDEQNKQVLIKHYYNIGIATDTPDGLKVPVVKNCETKNIIQIAIEIADLASRAKSKTIKLDEMTNGTFTITSLGNSFGQEFTPIINYPEVAIMGVGRVIEKPVILNGAIVPRKMLTLSLTADHRLIDGADASRFMNDVKNYLEDLNSLLIEMN